MAEPNTVSTALVVHDVAHAIEQAKRKHSIVRELRGTVFIEGIDFGVIPGTNKPTLLKPGAEKLCGAFGYSPEFEGLDIVQNWDDDNPLFHYRYRCSLRHIDSGAIVATGIGSCNSKESKYRWRTAERVCTTCGMPAIIKGKSEWGGGWVCFKKKGGCGAKFDDNDPAIVNQSVGRVENDDIFSIVNTIDKMAQKRALIAAILIGAGASEFFTQDIEDMPQFQTATTLTENTVAGVWYTVAAIDELIERAGDAGFSVPGDLGDAEDHLLELSGKESWSDFATRAEAATAIASGAAKLDTVTGDTIAGDAPEFNHDALVEKAWDKLSPGDKDAYSQESFWEAAYVCLDKNPKLTPGSLVKLVRAAL